MWTYPFINVEMNVDMDMDVDVDMDMDIDVDMDICIQRSEGARDGSARDGSEGSEGRAGETEARGAPPDFAWTSYNSIKEIVRRLEAHISNAFPDSKHQRVRSHRELVDLAWPATKCMQMSTCRHSGLRVVHRQIGIENTRTYFCNCC